MPFASRPTGSETILVVDDDPVVLAITSALLARSGYRVVQAANPAGVLDQVLAICAGDNIRLLLTDVMMPNITGPQLAACLLALRPDMRVLLMSGYHDPQVEQHSFKHFLRKPFSLATLLATVRTVLDEPCKRAPGRQVWDDHIRKAQG